MATSTPKQPSFRPLAELLPKNNTGDAEFEHIVSVLLRIHTSRVRVRRRIVTPIRLGQGLWLAGDTLCLCRLPSRSDGGDYELLSNLAGEQIKELRARGQPTHLIIAQPRAVANTKSRASGDFKKYLDTLCNMLPEKCITTWWDAKRLKDILVAFPPLGLHYYPESLPDGPKRRQAITVTRQRYDREFAKLHGKIQFVGMSVYKEEASVSVDMDRIYIPLRVVPESAVETGTPVTRTNPLNLLTPGARHVILGDPGSGKSTLLRFLALAGSQPQLMRRYGTDKDNRLPVLVTLRRYVDELKSRPGLSLLNYMLELTRSDLGPSAGGTEFFDYHLYSGQAIILLDGLDELPSPHFKATVRTRVAELLQTYPGNTTIVTSRIVGYDKEVRYDNLSFSHHRVARLSLEDITGFVANWYDARLENAAERRRHADDLIRIINDIENRAIRALAENPLLLTIMCLVHRIDAVLPDERVVLYQKCTETLLNTWHAWKFHSEETRSRNKVEHRNRARMEAIAYWMHCLLDEAGKAQRAVVPYADLRDFLAQYIAQIEEPSRGDPRALAEVFLRFVKERAGLLIEVGDELYSFVHLTFQEYLTATYLRKSGETAGVRIIWDLIDERCGDSRWHEVIRLLVGALERKESQEYLLERILPKQEDDRYIQRALLAGGCLLDNVDAAEHMHQEILDGLLRAAATADSVEALRGPLRILRTWQDQEPGNREILARLVRQADRGPNEDNIRIGLGLNLFSLGWNDQTVWQTSGRLQRLSVYDGQTCAVSLLAEDRPSQGSMPVCDQERLRESLMRLCLRSPTENFIAMVLSSLCLTQNAGEPCPPLPQLLTCLQGIAPFMVQVHSCLVTQYPFDEDTKQIKIKLMKLADAGGVYWRNWHPFVGEYLGRARVLAWALDLARGRTLKPVLGLFQDESLAGRIDEPLSGRFDWALVPLKEDWSWKAVLEDRGLHSPLLEALCDVLHLTPRPQWWEALRLHRLSLIPKRITLTDPRVWRRTEEAFASHCAAEADCQHAASQLLFDVWLWFAGCHDNLDQSPFASLAQLTHRIDTPPLRLAHCIRDLAYGDESRVDDLIAMVHSTSPEYCMLLEEVFWSATQKL